MRPIEILVCLANLLALLVIVLPLPRGMVWMRAWVPIAQLIAVIQVLGEGLRWQMIPAYILTEVLCLIWLVQNTSAQSWLRGHRVLHRLSVGCGLVGFVVSIILPVVVPVFHFPKPSGPYAIGTLTYHWVDPDRLEIFGTDRIARRELIVQIWYPATGDPSAPHVAYMADATAVMAAFARIQQKPEFLFRHFQYVTTNAIASAPVAGDSPSYPVLLFLEGVTGFRQMNTFQVEELVSHGYIVAALDQPGAAAEVVFPDGHQVAGLALDQMGLIRQSYLPAAQAPVLHGQIFAQSIIPYLAQDVSFTLNQLTALNAADPNGILTGRLDMQQVGTFGVSLGGIVVGEACRLEPRLRACLVMDAPMPSDVVQLGLQQPSMWITRDAESMRLERQRSGGWPEAEIQAHLSSMRAVYQHLPGAGYFVQVPGMFHANLMDFPNWLPLAAQLGLTGPIDGQRAHDIINAYTRAFFDRHLKGQSVELLDGPAAGYPDVLFETHHP